MHTAGIAYSQYTQSYPCPLVHSHTHSLPHIGSHIHTLTGTYTHAFLHMPLTHIRTLTLTFLLSHSHTQPTHIFPQFAYPVSHMYARLLRNMGFCTLSRGLSHAQTRVRSLPHVYSLPFTYAHALESWGPKGGQPRFLQHPHCAESPLPSSVGSSVQEDGISPILDSHGSELIGPCLWVEPSVAPCREPLALLSSPIPPPVPKTGCSECKMQRMQD